MKNYVFAICLLCLSSVKAQVGQNCGFNLAYQKLFSQDAQAKARFDNVTQNLTTNKTNDNQTNAATSFTIPIVFHVLHLGGAENISDAQINDAVAILNRDYRKLNADITAVVPEFTAIAADCNIQFSLATIDDNGNCTNGITRHYDTRTNWTMNLADYVYTWNRTKYLNVYLVNSMQSGVAGYAYLPGTAPAPADAIVILHNYVGSIGTSNPYTSRALTHEVGHWFNLSHTWGNTNNPQVACGDDGVSDTPITKGHYSCNLGNAVDCTVGVVENIQNYMEYAYCENMFTQGQRTRMHACLNAATAGRNNLSSNSNLMATGIISPLNNCAPKAEFYVTNKISCVGNGLAFVDQSYNAPVANWLWSSPLSANTSTVQLGILNFTNSGITSVKLKVGNVFGSDSITKQQFVTVLAAGTNSGAININQGFETGIFPDNNWIASIPQYGSPFLQTNAAAASGTNCVWVNNYFDNPNEAVSFYSPAFNLQNTFIGLFSFKYVYAQQNANNNDILKVYVSSNCGTSWDEIFSATGASLSTTGNLEATPILTPTPVQWKTKMINLQPYSGKAKVYFKFEFTPDVNGPGNNLFIDDININTVIGIKENAVSLNGINLFPNPFTQEVTIENTGNEGINSIKIMDISGRTEMEIKPNDAFAKKIVLNNVKELNAGIYFAEIKTQSGCKVVKLMKQ